MTLAKPVEACAVALLVGLATSAGAGESSKPGKCEQVIERAGASYLAAYTDTLRRCEKLRLQGVLSADVDCQTNSADELQGIRIDLEDAIGKACGGADKTCGTPDDVTLAEAGWADVTHCPDIDGSGCTNSISTCADVTECLACSGAAAAKQVVSLTFDEFTTAEFGTKSDVNACQRAIGMATTKFLQVSARALAKCWSARLSGKQDGDCPDGTGKDGEMVAKAEAKKRHVICKACGGADKDCGGSDDQSVDAIGFASDCPDLHVPSGDSCGGAILDVPDVLDCVDCVAKFKAECMARLAAPGAGDYPPECNPSSVTTTTSTPGSTTTTTLHGLCGNGTVDPGEQCDPGSSAGGSFTCAPGQTCTPQCTCSTPGLCGNGVVDPGEECDPGSAGGAFACMPGVSCSAQCTCGGATTTLCDVSTTTTSTTTPPTTTTVPGTCGNGVHDPGEECDPSCGSPSGSFTCPSGSECDASTCRCVPVGGSTTTSTTVVGGSTTSSTMVGGPTTSTTIGVTTTTHTGTTSPVTTTTQPGGSPSFLDFTTGQSSEDCGAFYDSTTPSEDSEIDTLTCGGLNIGGGLSTVLEGPTPDGSTSRFTVSCNGNNCTLGATTTAGPGFECTGTGCNFGTPLPIPNGGITTCVSNTFAAPASGTVDLATGTMSANVSLASRVVLTGNAAQPCPICRSGSISGSPCVGSPGSPCTGVCQGSPNQGAACTSTNSEGLSSDCPGPNAQQGANVCYGGTGNGQQCTTSGNCGGGVCSTLVGTIPVNLTPLTTSTASKSNGGGIFCPDQTNAGCFGDDTCRAIVENGAAAGALTPVGSSHSITLASVFCIPASGAILIDSSASLPGPGATSLIGTVKLVP
jgi:hypothetical protein